VCEKDGDRQSHPAAESQDRVADTAAVLLNPEARGDERRTGPHCGTLIAHLAEAGLRSGRRGRNTGGQENRRLACLPLVGAPTESVIQNERQNQNLLIKENQNQNTNRAPEGLPLVGITSSESHRKERRETTHTFSDFMIIFRLENARTTPFIDCITNVFFLCFPRRFSHAALAIWFS
jgi:hypothetical protein